MNKKYLLYGEVSLVVVVDLVERSVTSYFCFGVSFCFCNLRYTVQYAEYLINTSSMTKITTFLRV
jgi:hypothetical protein